MADAAAWDARLKSALDALVPPAAAPAAALAGGGEDGAADAAEAEAALHACGGGADVAEEARTHATSQHTAQPACHHTRHATRARSAHATHSVSRVGAAMAPRLCRLCAHACTAAALARQEAGGRPFRPLERREYLRRLRSFTPSLWGARPGAAGPVAAARRGWRAAGAAQPDLVACDACGARVAFPVPPEWSVAQLQAVRATARRASMHGMRKRVVPRGETSFC
jgi:hypothetical protein